MSVRTLVLVGRFCLGVMFFLISSLVQNANAQEPVRRTDKPITVSLYMNKATIAETQTIKSRNPEVGFHIFERQEPSYTSAGPERIKSYIVRVEIQPNGDLDIIETIVVHADNDRIKRGILRDMPRLKSVSVPGFLPYSAKEGVVPYRYNIRSVTRNGRPETFVTEQAGREKDRYRVKIGRAWDYLDRQDYVYEIAYTVKDEIRRFKKADELYWNVIGTGWAFPIENARILIIAPEGLTINESHIFTGKQGETNDHASLISKDNLNRVILTRPLNKGEGVTVSLIWPADSFGNIPFSTNAYYFTQHHKNGLTLSISSLIFFLYCLYAWLRYGRDPDRPPLFPEYFPPKGYSVAAVNHLVNRGISGHRAFIATLKSLQAKKFIKLRSIPSMTEISVLDYPAISPGLDVDELTLYNLLFDNGETKTIKLRDEFNSDFHERYESFLTSIRERYDGRFYRSNGMQIFVAITLAISIFLWVAFSGPQDIGSYVLPALGMFLLLGFTAFCFIIGAPTEEGVTLKAKIDGLELFLSLTDEEKLNAYKLDSGIPTMSRQRYREILPFAVAVNMEKPWTAYFKQVIPHNVDPTAIVGSSSYDDYDDFFENDFEYDHMNNLIEACIVPPPPAVPSSSSDNRSSYDNDYSSSYSTTDSSSSGGGYSGGGGGGYSGGGGGGGGGDGW